MLPLLGMTNAQLLPLEPIMSYLACEWTASSRVRPAPEDVDGKIQKFILREQATSAGAIA